MPGEVVVTLVDACRGTDRGPKTSGPVRRASLAAARNGDGNEPPLVSVRVAALRPELVRRLVLVSPPGVGPPRFPLSYAWPLPRTMLGARPSFLVRLTYDGLRAGPRNLARGGLHVARADVTAELTAVTASTLVVWGARDGVVPVEEASAWLERLPDARLIVIPGAGHVPMLESPVELADAIRSFLEERFDEASDHQRM
jgi:pimeloyl-ACP methyl ester carboxylesterase